MKGRDAGAVFDAGVVVALVALSAAAFRMDFGADYPYGDGGLFYAIVRTIVEGRFAYPATIDYNQVTVPFAYSPLAFYAVAALSSAGHLAIGRAMNLWVDGWLLLVGPIVYALALRLFRDRAAAAATAFVAIASSSFSVYLGMGGGITRAPGYALAIAGIVATWIASNDGRKRDAACATVATGLTALCHMEFLLLEVVSIAVLVAMRRVRPRTAALVLAGGAALSSPWPIAVVLSHGPGTFFAALRTAHGTITGEQYARLALTLAGVADRGNAAGLVASVAVVLLALRREAVFLVWIVVLIVVDTRAGPQLVHLPFALACGSFVTRFATAGTARLAASLLVGLVVCAGVSESAERTDSVVRLSRGDVAAMVWIREHAPADAVVFTLFPPYDQNAFADNTYEWLPEFARRKSPVTWEGLEWVDPAAYASVRADVTAFQGRCSIEGPACVTVFVAPYRAAHRDVYLYVPQHSPYANALLGLFSLDPAYVVVRHASDGVVFVTAGRPHRGTPAAHAAARGSMPARAVVASRSERTKTRAPATHAVRR